MSEEPLANLPDAELVNSFREWAIEKSRCQFDPIRHNRIDGQRMIPIYEVLANRGNGSVAKLLPLLDDKNPHVRLQAAIFAYHANPELCGRAMKQLISEKGMVGLWAALMLGHKDPAFFQEIEETALHCEDLFGELARRHSNSGENG